MGCQWATSSRCGSTRGGCRSVMVISSDQEDADGAIAAVAVDPRQLTVNSQPMSRRVRYGSGHVNGPAGGSPEWRYGERGSSGVGGRVLLRGGRHVLLDHAAGGGHVAARDRFDDRQVPVAGHHRRGAGGLAV